MRRNFKLTFAKWISESILIALGVILGFYFENKRQEWADKRKVISDLKELKESIADDTLVFLNIRQYYIPSKDSLDRETLHLIEKKEPVAYILQGLWGNEQLNYKNWTVKRMLDGDELNTLDKAFRNEIWEYSRMMDEVLNGSIRTIRENDKQILDMAFAEIKYKNDFSKLYKLGDDQPLIRYREYSDSSIVYSDKLKGLTIYNLTSLGRLRYELQNHREYAASAIKRIEEEIRKLE